MRGLASDWQDRENTHKVCHCLCFLQVDLWLRPLMLGTFASSDSCCFICLVPETRPREITLRRERRLRFPCPR